MSNLYKPSLEEGNGQPQQTELVCVDQCGGLKEMGDLQLVGAPEDTCIKDDVGPVRQDSVMVDVEVKLAETGTATARVKQKAGRRLPRGGKVKPRTRQPPPGRRKTEEDDVCFICFDGGSLVLCDRKGCPKAYHPACIKREESFFRSKAKWNCGWHICSICEKASYYMCYTCPYSLCKGCTKGADYYSVRGNKGFCGICMTTILLIENCAPGNHKKVEVDFDDKTSWEYLFKVYWIFLKEKLLLTLDELTRAKNPCKESAVTAPKGKPSSEVYDGDSTKGLSSENCGDLDAIHPKRRKTKKQPECPDRLHSLITDNSGVVDAATSQVESNENHDNWLMMGDDKRRKTSKKADKRGGLPNANEYAAIDVHNINLIYLKRCSVENLIDEADKFNDKVVGSIVRIRLPVSDQKQDVYRLVQVVGTSKAAEPYKIGERTTDIILEICNLQKKEVVAIDAISNQDFSEDECIRLCQSIKCGFITHLTVGEIQEKAMSLQVLRVNDLLESGILRLSNFCDRASEKGHGKELRELVEKVQVSEERKRQLLEIPEVHADPKMDPHYESEEDDKEFDETEQDIHVKPRNPSLGRKEKESSLGSNVQKSSATILEGNICTTATDSLDGDGNTLLHQRVSGYPSNQEKGSIGSENSQVGFTIPVTGGWNDNAVQRPAALSKISSGGLSLSNSQGMVQPSIDFETQNMWHYQDPVGRIQGPFSLVQLRKWSTSGCFPLDFRVWRISQKRDDSVLLTDVLNGWCNKELLLMDNCCLVPQEVRAASDDGSKTGDYQGFGSMDTTEKDCKSVDGSLDSMQNDGSAHSKSNDEYVKINGGGCQPSSLTTPTDVISNEGKIVSLLQGSDPLKDNHSVPVQPLVCNSLPSVMLAEKSCETMLLKEKHQTMEGQINIGNGYDKQVDRKDNSGQSSRQNCRAPPIDNSSSGCDSNSVFVLFAKALEIPDQNQEVDFSDMPSPTPKLNQGDLNAGIRQSLPSKASVQDSGPSWSTASSSMGGRTHLPDVSGEWGGFSSTPSKPSVEECGADLMRESSLQPSKLASDHAATPTSGSCQPIYSSPSHPASNATSWHAMFVTTLGDESVSDLLAEVEAMESLNPFASTSDLHCDMEFRPENDCFIPIGVLSPAPDAGKSDALSSSSDLQMHSHSTVTEETLGVSQAEVLDPYKRSSGHSSMSAEVDKDTKPSDDSISQCKVGSKIQPALPPVTSWDISALDASWRLGSDTANISQRAVRGISNLGLGGFSQERIEDTGLGAVQWIAQEHSSVSMGTSKGNSGIWESHPRYVGDRLSGSRYHGFHGRDSSFEKSSLVWNGQGIYDVENGGSFRLLPDEQ